MVEQKCIFGSGLCLKVHINLRLQQARLAVRHSFALATGTCMCRAQRESGALIYLLCRIES